MSFLVMCIVFGAFLLSASCGMGGSLLLIPAMTMLFGVKQGIVISSLLLGLNNIFKVHFYRKQVDWQSIKWIVFLIASGSAVGAVVMIRLNELVLSVILGFVIVISFMSSFSISKNRFSVFLGTFIAFQAGLFSGLVGMSGPLKGLAIKHFVVKKESIVSCAAVISLVSDMIKTSFYMEFSKEFLISNVELIIYAIILMPLASYLGKHLNERMSLKAYNGLFYLVMSGYFLRLIL